MGLFASFLIPLDVRGLGPGPGLRAVREALIPRGYSPADRALVGDLHDEDRERALTISHPATLGGTYAVRITTLNPELGVHVLRSLDGRPLGAARVAPASEWLACVAQPEELVDEKPASSTDRIGVHFLSPTTFRVGDRFAGRGDSPLPEPLRVVGSWLRQVEPPNCPPEDAEVLLSGIDRAAFLDWVRGHVRLAGEFFLAGSTEQFEARGQPQRLIGARGWFRLHVEDREGPERRALRALARAAPFAGTGRKTVLGFGQTWTVVNGPDPKSDERTLHDLVAAHAPFDEVAGSLATRV